MDKKRGLGVTAEQVAEYRKTRDVVREQTSGGRVHREDPPCKWISVSGTCECGGLRTADAWPVATDPPYQGLPLCQVCGARDAYMTSDCGPMCHRQACIDAVKAKRVSSKAICTQCGVPFTSDKPRGCAKGDWCQRERATGSAQHAEPCPCCAMNAPLNEACVAYEKEIEALKASLNKGPDASLRAMLARMIEVHDGSHNESCDAFGHGSDAEQIEQADANDDYCDCGGMRLRNEARAMLGTTPCASPDNFTNDSEHIEGRDEMATKTKTADRAVIVTTEHRGVFFGYASDTSGDQIALRDSRLCLFWSADVKGFMGLAGTGPTKGCRIGPPADITLRKITAVIECTDAAAKAWTAAPWSA